MPTESGYRKALGTLSDSGFDYLNNLQKNGAPLNQLELLASFLEEFEALIESSVYTRYTMNDLLYASRMVEYIIEDLYNHSNIIADLFRIYRAVGPSGKEFLNVLFKNITLFYNPYGAKAPEFFSWSDWHNNLVTFSSPGHPLWIEWNMKALNSDRTLRNKHPFEVFPNYSANVGLRLVYRQEWMPLGEQVGEIVRTIPLGPGQKERITTKIVRRTKKTSTTETIAGTETTTETSESTKDSSEVMKEAAETFNWSVKEDVSASFFGLASGSLSSTQAGSEEERSKQTSSRLSESMQKAASKIRRETKVVVSTESEETFEVENFSEISNPNNEIAITYEYQKLQRQYEVVTYLAEAQSVIYVAEYLPSRGEIDEEWVRKHDWIIAKVLKDESHRTTLNELINDVDEESLLVENAVDPFSDLATKAGENFAKFNAGGQISDLNIPDIYSEAQKSYRDYLKEKKARERANKIRRIKRERLYEHIRDNILHYCQAIWAHEDNEQRLLRYKKEGRRVPVEWERPNRHERFVPTGKDAPLWELIDPTGRIDFIGNYAVFTLRPLPEGFLDSETGVDGDNVMDMYTSGMSELNVAWVGGRETLNLDGILAQMRTKYEDPDGEEGILLDPALRGYRRQADDMDPQFLKELQDDTVLDIVSYIPRLESGLLDNNGALRKQNGELKNPISPRDYAEYRWRKNGTRRFLVDSNNLYLNVKVCNGAALEPFKRAHRYIDVLKANEELNSMKLKNQRRTTHMNDVNEFDPDIEKVVIVGDENGRVAIEPGGSRGGGGSSAPGVTPQ